MSMWRNIFSPEKKRPTGDADQQFALEAPKAPTIALALPKLSLDVKHEPKAIPPSPRGPVIDAGSTDHRLGHGSDHVVEEYQRRMKVLSVCLEEKAEENIELYKKLQAQQELVQKRDAIVKELQAAIEVQQEQQRVLAEKLDSQQVAVKHQEVLVSEFTRRTQVLSMCLDEMAQENISLTTKLAAVQGMSREELAQKLQHFSRPADQHVEDKSKQDAAKKSGSSTVPAPMSAEERLLQDYFDVIAAVKDDRARELLQRFQRALTQESDNHKKANAHLQQSEEDLTQQKANVSALEKQVKQLTSKLLKEKDQKQSFQESCEKYEKKMRKLEIKAKESLQKEGKRRTEAEYIAGKLKKKVSELTFLLKEKADSSSEDESAPSAPAEPSVAEIRASFLHPTDTPRPTDTASAPVSPSDSTLSPTPSLASSAELRPDTPMLPALDAPTAPAASSSGKMELSMEEEESVVSVKAAPKT